MSMTTKTETNCLTLAEVQAVAPALFIARNSKRRPTPLHLESAPGAGKTMITRAIAQAMARLLARRKPGTPFGYIVANVQNYNPTDIAGFPLFTDYEGQKYSTFTVPSLFHMAEAFTADPEGEITTHTKDDSGNPIYVGSMVMGMPVVNGLLVLDEFMQADAETRKTCASLLDEGRIATHRLPPGWAVWACSNRAADRSGVGKGLAFLTNRVVKVSITPDFESFDRYLAGEPTFYEDDTILPLAPIDRATGRANGRISVHPVLRAYARQNQDLLYAGVPVDPGEAFLTNRSLDLVCSLFDAMMVDADDVPVTFATDSRRARIFTSLVSGAIGSDNATNLNTTIALFEEVPTIPEILADPKKAKVSAKNDAQLIAAYQCANAMTLANGEALCTYLRRINDQFAKNAMLNAAQRDGSLYSISAINAMITNDPSLVTRMLVSKANAGKIAQQRRDAGARA